jgi:hypothetical protein
MKTLIVNGNKFLVKVENEKIDNEEYTFLSTKKELDAYVSASYVIKNNLLYCNGNLVVGTWELK